MDPSQDTLFALGADAHEDTNGRTAALAGFLAGWRWPGAGSFDRLPKAKRDAAMRAARSVEAFLAEADG